MSLYNEWQWCLILSTAVGCGVAEPPGESLSRLSLAATADGLSSTNLALSVSGNSCWASGAQYYFQTRNNDASGVKLSDITIKYWVNDTTGSNVVPHVWYGGCVTTANGTCVHPVSNVTATATQFSACSADSQHQANWEITVSTTDSATLPAGATWSGLQTASDLASHASFSPGSNTWYSPCGNGQPFHSDVHFAVYANGGLVTTNGLTPPVCRAPHGSQPITSYTVPPITDTIGTLPDNQLLTLALSLPVRNMAGLQAVADAASDPSSPTYRQWLTPAQLDANYAPLAADYTALKAWATSKGFQISSSPSRAIVGLVGTVAQIERAFYVNLITARRPDGTVFYTPDRVPTIDFGVQVLAVSGIDNFVPATPAFSGGTAPVAGTFQSSDFRGAYLGTNTPCSSLNGAGQTVGIFANYAGFNLSDIQNYIINTGLTAVPAVQVNVAGTPDGATPTPIPADDSLTSAETALDIEMVTAMAPGAQVVVFEGNNVDLILDAMANSTNIAQFTSSWTVGASATTTQIHTLMAAQGQAFFEASGDSGSYANTTVAPTAGNPGCGPFPANMSTDMPYITLVGGTELNVAAGTYVSETAWAGSSGGILPATTIPAWQVNANPGNAKLSTTSRNVPDVSMPGNGIFLEFSGCDNQLPPIIGRAINPAQCTGNILCNVAPGGMSAIYLGCKAGGETKGMTTGVNGTSAATPLWAGFMALTNQRNQAQGKIGFLNPTIYAIGRGANYATSFHDITIGAPIAACDATQFGAQAGYDQVTGWGSPQCGLMAQLSPQVTPPQLPRLSVAGTATASINAPVNICGKGANFTPGSAVIVTMSNVPTINGGSLAPFTIANATVAADGTFGYSRDATSMPAAVFCTDAQRFWDVTVTATNSLQEVANNTFSAGYFCSNTTLATNFGGGCP